MSKGGSTTNNTTTTEVKNEVDPDIKAAYLKNIDYARDVANNMGQQQFADFNPQYTAGEQQIQAAAQGGVGMQNLNTAADLTKAAAGYAPQSVSGVSAGPAAMYGGAQANMANIGQYMNPYTQQVIDASISDLEKARQKASQQIGQQASQAKAFGGSRHGVAEAMSNAEYGNTAGKTIAQLRQQGFDTAANLMQQDLNRSQQAGLSNQAALNQMSQYNASNQQQANLANQSADLQGAQFRLGAANQLGNMGQQQQAQQYAAGQQLMNLGSARQQQAQAQLDASRNLGAQRLGLMQGALGIQPPNMGSTMTTNSPMYQNTGANVLGGAMAGYSMFGPWGALGGGLLGLM